jgi:hypothetical protein
VPVDDHGHLPWQVVVGKADTLLDIALWASPREGCGGARMFGWEVEE